MLPQSSTQTRQNTGTYIQNIATSRTLIGMFHLRFPRESCLAVNRRSREGFLHICAGSHEVRLRATLDERRGDASPLGYLAQYPREAGVRACRVV
jgi:hypothetical protein